MIYALPAAEEDGRLMIDAWRIPRADVEAFDTSIQLLSFARARAAAIEAEASAAMAAARRRGHETGLAEGREQARSAVAAALADLLAASEARDNALRTDLGELAVEVVRRVSGDLGAADMLERVAAHAMAAIADEAPFALRVSVALASSAAEQLRHSTGLRIIADASLPEDGCVFETRQGRIDASLEVQLSALQEALRTARAARP